MAYGELRRAKRLGGHQDEEKDPAQPDQADQPREGGQLWKRQNDDPHAQPVPPGVAPPVGRQDHQDPVLEDEDRPEGPVQSGQEWRADPLPPIEDDGHSDEAGETTSA